MHMLCLDLCSIRDRRCLQVTPLAQARILWITRLVHIRLEQLEDRRDPYRLLISFRLLDSVSSLAAAGCC